MVHYLGAYRHRRLCMPTARSQRPSEVKGRCVAATVSEFEYRILFRILPYLPIFVLFTLPWPGLLYSVSGTQHLVKYFCIWKFSYLDLSTKNFWHENFPNYGMSKIAIKCPGNPKCMCSLYMFTIHVYYISLTHSIAPSYCHVIVLWIPYGNPGQQNIMRTVVKLTTNNIMQGPSSSI